MEKGNCSCDIIPKFFKVYLPGESGDDLKLPISFNSYLPNCLPKNVTLKSVHRNIWKMALRKCGGEIYVMVNGLKMIQENEDLKGGDFLVFEFDGSRCFNFCIYEPETMCKRLRRNTVQSDEIMMGSDGEDETRATDDFLGFDDNDVEEDDSDDSDYNYSDDNVVKEDDSDDADYNYSDDNVVEDDHDDEDYLDASAVKDDDDIDADDVVVVNNDELKSVDVDGDVETVDADDDVKSVDADVERQYLDDGMSPSFTLTLNPKNKRQLLIPARLIKDYDLHFPESITLVDPLVKKFGPMEKKMKIQKNSTHLSRDLEVLSDVIR